jgi:7,8-dihydro-6-hydroxymethylpterin-pyrophosphokinase (HPPK)
MKLHRFVLTLGSNSEPQKHLSLAQAGLRDLGLEHLTFSPARESAPISFGLSDALFTDQVAVGETSMELETFAAHLKALERHTGRTPEQRKKHPEAIPVDIDLITWDREILKPRDITRPYLIEGLRELGEPLLPEE